jgi:hypothetical protein
VEKIISIIKQAEEGGLKHRAIKAARTYLSGSKKEILAYKKAIEKTVKDHFGEVYDEAVLGYICPITQCLDQLQRSYENNKRKRFWQEKILEARAKFRAFDFINQDEVDQAINRVASIMSSAKKSNSLIETVNSVIRRYLFTYKSIPSWFCPIFTFYWNHRTFKRGKRKGLKPREVLTGEQWDEDWIDVLLEDYPFSKDSSRPEVSSTAAIA